MQWVPREWGSLSHILCWICYANLEIINNNFIDQPFFYSIKIFTPRVKYMQIPKNKCIIPPTQTTFRGGLLHEGSVCAFNEKINLYHMWKDNIPVAEAFFSLRVWTKLVPIISLAALSTGWRIISTVLEDSPPLLVDIVRFQTNMCFIDANLIVAQMIYLRVSWRHYSPELAHSHWPMHTNHLARFSLPTLFNPNHSMSIRRVST